MTIYLSQADFQRVACIIQNLSDFANVRDRRREVLEIALSGERYSITGRVDTSPGTWWQIDYKGQSGWVFGNYVITE